VAEGDGIHDDAEALRRAPVKEVVDGEDGVVVVRLTGELDLYNAPALREALFGCAKRGPERLVVDLADVTFVDSTVLGVLIEARTKLHDRRGFMLASPGLETRRALEVSGLDRHLSVHDTVDDALATRL
jgi:anti-sigma B factor antagonist